MQTRQRQSFIPSILDSNIQILRVHTLVTLLRLHTFRPNLDLSPPQSNPVHLRPTQCPYCSEKACLHI
jgi:hypothetical protein